MKRQVCKPESETPEPRNLAVEMLQTLMKVTKDSDRDLFDVAKHIQGKLMSHELLTPDETEFLGLLHIAMVEEALAEHLLSEKRCKARLN
jgi:hypothetical protein